jgi:aspartate kinase
MEVFKFGGASIQSPGAIRNMAEIINKYGDKPLVVVVSAMGKTTRNLEAYIDAVVKQDKATCILADIKKYHFDILDDLFEANNNVFSLINELFDDLEKQIWHEIDFSKFYDSIVSYGEMMSSTIITSFLNSEGITSTRLDAPEVIKCTGKFQRGKVNWQPTEILIRSKVAPILEDKIAVTQGFIGSNSDNEVITLGKEGSDYSAAIFAACLNANKVTIWKDVPGILSADPKLIEDTKQILHMPYTEASEMTYYGACVIHPKTIKPLANKEIPLYVRSFDDPAHIPTEIKKMNEGDIEPTIILKKNQCLFTFRVRDYTFVDEKNLALIFSTLSNLDISINIMQNSAITISVCFDYKKEHIDALLSNLQDHFSLHYMTNLQLVTLKNYNEGYLKKYYPENEIIIEQRTRRNCRFLVKS